MKNKIKNVVCGTLLTVALALMMILTTVSTGLVSGGTNLKVAEAEELPRVTISFDANGGSGYMDIVYENAYSNYILPECTFTAPENRQFKCWEVLKEGSKDEYEEIFAGETYRLPNAYTLIFRAVWEDVAEENPIEPVMKVTYNGTITVGETLDLSKVSIQIVNEYDENQVLRTIEANNNKVYYVLNSEDIDVTTKTFDTTGIVTIRVEYRGPDADYFVTEMTVEVVAAQEEEPAPAPETPEQPEIEEPVVEQPTEEVKPAEKDNNGLGLGAILGIVFGSLAVLGLGGSLLWAFVFRK